MLSSLVWDLRWLLEVICILVSFLIWLVVMLLLMRFIIVLVSFFFRVLGSLEVLIVLFSSFWFVVSVLVCLWLVFSIVVVCFVSSFCMVVVLRLEGLDRVMVKLLVVFLESCLLIFLKEVISILVVVFLVIGLSVFLVVDRILVIVVLVSLNDSSLVFKVLSNCFYMICVFWVRLERSFGWRIIGMLLVLFLESWMGFSFLM